MYNNQNIKIYKNNILLVFAKNFEFHILKNLIFGLWNFFKIIFYKIIYNQLFFASYKYIFII